METSKCLVDVLWFLWLLRGTEGFHGNFHDDFWMCPGIHGIKHDLEFRIEAEKSWNFMGWSGRTSKCIGLLRDVDRFNVDLISFSCFLHVLFLKLKMQMIRVFFQASAIKIWGHDWHLIVDELSQGSKLHDININMYIYIYLGDSCHPFWDLINKPVLHEDHHCRVAVFKNSAWCWGCWDLLPIRLLA